MSKGKKSEINKNAVNIGTKDTDPSNIQDKKDKNRKK
jgi:hypothetical protein